MSFERLGTASTESAEQVDALWGPPGGGAVPALPGLAPADSAARSPGLYCRGGKRLFDILVTLLLLPLALVLVGLAAALVALDGANPIFVQYRVGRQGRIYRIWKLRTMVPRAEDQLAQLRARNPDLDREWRHNQKLARDPRITWFGRILRKFSIDELPQLWNVLTGEMSLVGPRPMMPCQQRLYRGRAYYALRPGITGPWQVLGRGCTSFAARVAYDEIYARDLGLVADLRLLAATVRVVLRGTGS